MPSEIEFVPFKEFVESLPAKTVALSGDSMVVNNSVAGPSKSEQLSWVPSCYTKKVSGFFGEGEKRLVSSNDIFCNLDDKIYGIVTKVSAVVGAGSNVEVYRFNKENGNKKVIASGITAESAGVIEIVINNEVLFGEYVGIRSFGSSGKLAVRDNAGRSYNISTDTEGTLHIDLKIEYLSLPEAENILSWLNNTFAQYKIGVIGGDLYSFPNNNIYVNYNQGFYGILTKVKVNVSASSVVNVYKYNYIKNSLEFIKTASAENVGILEIAIDNVVFNGEAVAINCSGQIGYIDHLSGTYSRELRVGTDSRFSYDIQVEYFGNKNGFSEEFPWFTHELNEKDVGAIRNLALYSFSSFICVNKDMILYGSLNKVYAKVSSGSVVSIYKWNKTTMYRELLAKATAVEDGVISIDIPDVPFNGEYLGVNSSGKIGYMDHGSGTEFGYNAKTGAATRYSFDIAAIVKTIDQSNEDFSKIFNDDEDVVYFGDSFIDIGILPTEIQRLIGGNVVNRGVSATTVSAKTASDNCLCHRMDGTSVGSGHGAALPETCSCVVICAGTNDFGNGSQDIPLGTLSEGIGNIYHFYSAAQYLLKGLIEKYPAAKIVWITPIHKATQAGASFTLVPDLAYDSNGNLVQNENLAGMTLKNVVDAIKEVCSLFSVKVADAYSESGIYTINDDQNVMYTQDGLHPNQAGSVKIAKLVYNELKKN